MSEGTVSCTYSIFNSTGNLGSIVLKDCNPAISNDETMGPGTVIFIVVLLVLAGLAGQWVLGHIDRKALAAVRDDLKTAATHAAGIAKHDAS